MAKGDFAAENPEIQGYVAQIHKDYDGVVLCKEVIPNPPIRGKYGQAFITLKEGAIPTRQKPFRQFREKHEAMLQIVREWLARGSSRK